MIFKGAERLRFHGVDLVVLKNARDYRDELIACHEQLLRLATFSRGWGEAEIPRMREVFKIEPFYRATSLVLAFDRDQMCGTAGVDADFANGSGEPPILHLCSVNLLPALRNSGVTALLFVLLADHLLTPMPAGGNVYFTSISQSPLVYRLLARLGDVHPNGRDKAPADVQRVARTVVAKYDAHIPLDAENLILRNECEFFYKKVPYVADQQINAMFNTKLNISGGDVFVNVGKSKVADTISFIDRYRKRVTEMLEAG
jgi:hypothetical protein